MKMMKKNYIIYPLSGLLILLFLVTRLWQLTTLPAGLHIDEASMAYNAWCLSRYGVDRYLDSWPAYFANFEGGQSSMYAFLCALLFKLFGYHRLLIRIPAVIFSGLTMIFGMLLTKKLYPRHTALPLFTGLVITVCPYFILAGRFGLDCNLMLGMSSVFLYCFVCALEQGNNLFYILAGVTGGLILYTYALSYLVLPIFLLTSLIYALWTSKFTFKKWLVMAIPMAVIAFPIILVQIVNIFDLNELRLGWFTITKLEYYRSSELGPFHWIYLKQARNSIFIGDGIPYNSVPGFYNLYKITIPFAVLGLISLIVKFFQSIYQKAYRSNTFVFLWFLIILLFQSHVISNSNRINGIFLAAVLLAVEGVKILLSGIKIPYQIPLIAISAVYLLSFVKFADYYYGGTYAQENNPLIYFEPTYTEAIDFLEENPQYQNKGTCLSSSEIFYAVSTLRSPYELCFDEFDGQFDSYYFNIPFDDVDTNYNYIVQDYHAEFADRLRASGFTEITYDNYSLFYRK